MSAGDPIWHVDDLYNPAEDFWYRTLEGNLVGMEIGLWLSDLNAGLAKDQWDLNPLIVVGGQDSQTNDPLMLYTKLLETFGAEQMALLRTQFDVFVLTYWTGEGNQDTLGEARDLGLRRALQDNALLLADALYFIYSQAPHGLNASRPAALIGVSMGGLVSRFAFLGIERGTYPRPLPELVVNFAPFTVPIRLWITLDTPHQGAHIPVALQEMVDSFRFLPPLESTRETLSAKSSKEMLIDHFEGYNARVNGAFHTLVTNDPPGSGYQQERFDLHRLWKEANFRNLHPDRTALIGTLQYWGFPRTIGCSIAVASGSLSPEPDAPYLWQLTDGKIPWRGSRDRDGNDDICSTEWKRNSASLSAISEQDTDYMQTYNPLGPLANPLQQIELELAGFNSANFEVTISVKSLTTELTYVPWSTWYLFNVPDSLFYQNYKPYPEYNPTRCPEFSGIDIPLCRGGITPSKLYYLPDYRTDLQIVAEGAIKVNLPLLGDFPFEYSLPLAAGLHPLLPDYPADPVSGVRAMYTYPWEEVPYQKPKGYEPGGFLETVRNISANLEEAIGPISSLSSSAGVREATDYLPRHCFIPTISALDLNSDFLRAAWSRFRTMDAWIAGSDDPGGMNKYWRNTVRDLETGNGAYFEEDFLDYNWVKEYLGTTFPLMSNVWRTIDQSIWSPYFQYNGKSSPFDYLVVQRHSLAHTSFDSRTGKFIMGRIFAPDCDTPVIILPIEKFHLFSLWRNLAARFGRLYGPLDTSLIEPDGDDSDDEAAKRRAKAVQRPLDSLTGLLPPLVTTEQPPPGKRPSRKRLLESLGIAAS